MAGRRLGKEKEKLDAALKNNWISLDWTGGAASTEMEDSNAINSHRLLESPVDALKKRLQATRQGSPPAEGPEPQNNAPEDLLGFNSQTRFFTLESEVDRYIDSRYLSNPVSRI